MPTSLDDYNEIILMCVNGIICKDKEQIELHQGIKH
jgi:hypothetical protein